MSAISIHDIKPGETIAYLTSVGWACSGHYFSRIESETTFLTRESFACGAVRHERHAINSGWAVVRGTEVIPFAV